MFTDTPRKEYEITEMTEAKTLNNIQKYGEIKDIMEKTGMVKKVKMDIKENFCICIQKMKDKLKKKLKKEMRNSYPLWQRNTYLNMLTHKDQCTKVYISAVYADHQEPL
jgi:hypothetical protein